MKNKIKRHLRRHFYSKWTLLEAMVPGKYYYALELASENDFAIGTIHVKLFALLEGGFVDYRKSEQYTKMPDGTEVRRLQFRRTGKRIPIKPGYLQPQT